jgi:hypothetical protein
VGGLLSSKPRAVHARVAVVLSLLVTVAIRAGLSGSQLQSWVPFAAGIAAAGGVFAVAGLTAARSTT